MKIGDHQIRKWSEWETSEISIDAIRRKWPAPDFLVYNNDSSSTDWVSNLEVEGPKHICLVLRGTIELTFRSEAVLLKPGDFLTIDNNDPYREKALCDGKISFARVFRLTDLEEAFRQSSQREFPKL